MKNGHLPDHWQLKLWIGLAAVIIAALARQSAIDVGRMSSFNANILFLGILVAFVLLYLAFSSFLSEKVGLAIDTSLRKLFKWMGFKEGKPIEPEAEPVLTAIQKDEVQHSVEANAPTDAPNTIANEESTQQGIVKIETPTPKKIVIDYEGHIARAKKRQADKVFEKESNVIQYVGYVMAPFVDDKAMEKIIDAVTEYIHCKGVPDFPEEMAVELPSELTTTDMMHFGWNIAKPFDKYNKHTAYFLKQIFPTTFKDCEVITIERKLTTDRLKGNIKIDGHVELFEIPKEEEEKAQVSEASNVKSTGGSTVSKSKKEASSKKSKKSPNKKSSAMAAAFEDMEIEPYFPGQQILEEPDSYGY